MGQSANAWATAEFSHATLGDPRRVRRLVRMGEALAAHPAGRVTHAFSESAEREAAYRLVENGGFSWTDIAASVHAAAARRAAAHAQIIVPVDGVAFRIASKSGFGPISEKRRAYATGVQGMTALALTTDGVPLGVLGHRWWTRSTTPSPPWDKDMRPVADRETVHWLRVLDQSVRALREHAPSTRPWFQLDRGGDCADIFMHALELGVDITVRACFDRRVIGGKLWSKAATGKLVGTYSMTVARPDKRRRRAILSVRTRDVELRLRPGSKCRGPSQPTKMNVVEVRERHGGGSDAICWRLLTTKPVDTIQDALAVVRAYTRRWRIEEFHLAWKSGACGVEQSWMRDPEHFYKWATILSAVAARIERIKLLSRTEPDRSALDEYTRDEIDGAIALRKPKDVPLGSTPTLGQMTRWVADLGGYTGKSSGGPPGVRVLGRGLERVTTAAMTIASVRKDRRSRG